MRKLLLAFLITSCKLVFAPTVQEEQALTTFQQAVKRQLLIVLEDDTKEKECKRETKLLQELNMVNKFNDVERARIEEIATKLGLEKDWIYLIIHKESRGNHQAVNKHSGATGLIQFLPSTAKALGTTTKELRDMAVLEQLNYVELYLERVMKRYDIDSYLQLYLSVFYPRAVGKNNSYVIGSRGSKLVSLNKGMDVNHDGILTVKDFEVYAHLD